MIPPDQPARPQLVVGTAGHIDHGKSRLVLALTGTDPDRLPEEKARGMTIDLGFAHACIEDADVWFVDVPGHERFLRNMVAGATGIDLPLLVVAADDSIMPQTREHVEILRLLGFEHCLVALTKLDLVDDDWAGAVEQEVRDLLLSSGLTPLEILHTSATTGRGLPELRRALARLARDRPPGPHPACNWFRIPIDRSFSVPGRGTVVTGTVLHGRVRSADELELLPAGRRVRVRDLQTHHEKAELAAGRMRLALNLAGVAVEECPRGCELATPGYLQATTCLDVQIASLRMPGQTVRQRLRLRLHIATRDVLAQLHLLEPPAGLTLRDAFAQLRVPQPIVAAWGQHFILRDEAATRTLGGGRVLAPVAQPWSRRNPPQPGQLAALAAADPLRRVEAAILAARWEYASDAQLAARAGLPDAQAAQTACAALAACGRLATLAAGTLEQHVHAEPLGAAAARLVERLNAYLDRNTRAAGVPPAELAQWLPRNCPPRLRPAIVQWLLARGELVDVGGFMVPRGRPEALAPEDAALLDAILAEFHAGAFRPPALEELSCYDARSATRVRQLVELAVVRGRLLRVAEGLYLHAERWAELVRRLAGALEGGKAITVGEARTLLDSTRKYVVPILEFTDSQGLTRRRGDLRSLGPRAAQQLENASGRQAR